MTKKKQKAGIGHPVDPSPDCNLTTWIRDTEAMAQRRGGSTNLWNDVSEYYCHVLGGFPGATSIGFPEYRAAAERLLLDVDVVLITEKLGDTEASGPLLLFSGGLRP